MSKFLEFLLSLVAVSLMLVVVFTFVHLASFFVVFK